MRVYLNELSLMNPAVDDDCIILALVELLKFRQNNSQLKSQLYCSRLFAQTPIRDGTNLRNIVQRMTHDVRQLFFQWLANRGPFIEDQRQVNEDDLFYFQEIDVTDYGIGEVARRALISSPAAVLSLPQTGKGEFLVDSLEVLHGLIESPIQNITVQNYFDFDRLSYDINRCLPRLASWVEFIERAQLGLPNLLIGDLCLKVLGKHPFRLNTANQLLSRLKVLNEYVEELNENGRRTARGQEIYQEHFTGLNAWFSDEADADKIKFENEMSFPDPSNADVNITCYFHGKVKSPQYRIHFEWPVIAPFDMLKVAYIGPKISKR